VVFFGSARVDSRERAERALRTLRARGERDADAAYEKELHKTRKAVEWARFYEEARELARLLTSWSLTLSSANHRFVVTSAGPRDHGSRQPRRARSRRQDHRPQHPPAVRAGANRYITEGLHFEFHYFFMRKFWFAYLAKALVIFPGGFGTLRRAVRDPDAGADRQAVEEDPGHPLRTRLLVAVSRSEADGRVGRDRGEGRRAARLRRHAGDAFEQLRAHLITHHLEPPHPQEAAAPGIAKTRRLRTRLNRVIG
jgi:hypothetical protein